MMNIYRLQALRFLQRIGDNDTLLTMKTKLEYEHEQIELVLKQALDISVKFLNQLETLPTSTKLPIHITAQLLTEGLGTQAALNYFIYLLIFKVVSSQERRCLIL